MTSSITRRPERSKRPRFRRKALRRLLTVELALGLLLLVSSDTFYVSRIYDGLIRYAGNVEFDYFGWEVDALTQKVNQEIAGVQAYLTDDQRADYVYNYLAKVREEQSLNAQVGNIYANPSVSDPAAASADLRSKRDQALAEINQNEPIAESIVEGQVGSVLRDEGFATLGQVIPPVAAHITQLPEYLVISPRDSIRVVAALNVVNLTDDQANDLENTIDSNLNVSSIVAPLAGLSLYPSMIIRTSDALELFTTVAHEWCHHYLDFFPLGLNYDTPETRIINETTAMMFGAEIGREVIARFYKRFPDLMAQLPASTPTVTPTPATAQPRPTPQPTSQPTPSPTSTEPDVPPPFDPGATLNNTRITVDFYLWLGRVDLAEAYMRAQREVFADHGIFLRKLNQAFFAFYGGYQSAGGGGAGGSDPTGDAVARLRAHSPNVHAWLEQMRTLITRAELLSAAG